MPQQARLKVYGYGNVEVDLVIGYLTTFKHAYDSVLLFEATINETLRIGRDLLYPRFLFTSEFLEYRRIGRRYRAPAPEEIASSVPRNEQLVLCAVSLNSPGFWEFLGTLNAFEVLRKYLNDRHERRKDQEYRESAEKRKLALDNLSLENRVISERLRLAKEMGATDRDLAPLLNELIYRPLIALDRYQDKGVIENTEIVSDSDRTEGQAE